jgi:hypothetical protein
MRFVTTRTHSVFDYLVSVPLMASPWLFGFAAGGAETWLPVVLGAAALIYSVFTDYELGLVRKIPMPIHLALDLPAGALLAVSPWLFGFSNWVWAPHLIIGLFEICASLLTRTTPATARITAHRGPRLGLR